MSKFEYVAVTGSEVDSPIFNYFDNYLISVGEPLTSQKWDLYTMTKHAKRILRKKIKDKKLYIDSGGFQIIQDYVKKEYHRPLLSP